MAMVEQEQAHRIAIESKALRAEVVDTSAVNCWAL